MVLSKDICNESFMFKNCESLINLSIYDNKENFQDDELNIYTKFEENKKIVLSSYTNSDDYEFTSSEIFKTDDSYFNNSELIN